MVVFLSGGAFATTLTHSGGKVEIGVPDGWKSSQDGDTITLEPADEAMSVVFTIVDGDKADQVFEEIDKEVEKKVGEITWENGGKPSEVDVNSMDGYEYNGSAQKGKLNIYCLAINTPSDKTVLLYWFSDEASDKKYEKDSTFILENIKPLKTK
jgi:hypothetical protein